MFCPRCGRPVSEGANFCGGCGLPRREIERYARQKRRQMSTPSVAPRPDIPGVDIDELTGTIDRLQGDLSGQNPVNDYNTEDNTSTTVDDLLQALENRSSDGARPRQQAEEISTAQTVWMRRQRETYVAPKKEPEPAPQQPVRETAQQPRQTAGVYYNDSGKATDGADKLFNGGYTTPRSGYSVPPKSQPGYDRPRQAYTHAGNARTRESYKDTQSSYSYNAPKHPLYQDTVNTRPEPVAPRQTYRPPAQAAQGTEAPMTTVDFIWTILLSAIPLVGIFYVLYLAFIQSESVNKRSWARAMIIISVFGRLMSLVFFMGFFFALS